MVTTMFIDLHVIDPHFRLLASRFSRNVSINLKEEFNRWYIKKMIL